ncbi:hypothetical protein EJ02DRAFT_305769, partial [Clathrospora elynae]
PQPPSTPDQTRPRITRTGSASIAPKSEYLRNALQARRAQNTPTPAPLEMRFPPPPAPKPSDIKTPETSPDVFAEFALSEEQMAPVSPVRRRRPSDSGPSRMKTSRELTNEVERLRETLMTTNMRVELLKTNNKELQHSLTEANEQLEQLERLEDENYDLQTENTQLRDKVERMAEEITRLRDTNDEHCKTNEELTAIASESAAHWQAHEFAIEEAAECIIKMEEEKCLLSTELKQLKERVAAIEFTSSPTSTLVDGSPRYPSRVYSVDELRPSTIHFDSDYYSQPGSPPPPVKASSESIASFTPSERSKKFLDLTEERRRSARDLVKRMSAASLKALTRASPSPPPEVPRIPSEFQRQTRRIVEEQMPMPPQNIPSRHRKGRPAVPPSLLDAAEISPVRPKSVAQQAPTSHPDGLRGLYHPDNPSRSRPSIESRLATNHVSSANAGSFASRQQSLADLSPRVPSRGSSKHATGSSSEHLPRSSPLHRHQLEGMGFAHTPRTTPASGSSEWASLVPTTSVSTLSQNDLTSEVDPREDKERWWRSMDRLTLPQVLAQQQQSAHGIQHPQHLHHTNATRPADESRPRKFDAINSSLESQWSGGRQSRTAPSIAHNSPYMANDFKDFLFNGAESEEDFLRRA